MANFNTHLLGASLVAGAASSSLLMTGLFTASQGMGLWLMGIIGGLLPDIDSDASPLLKTGFIFLGVGGAFSTLMFLADQPLLTLWVGMVAAFFLVRYGLFYVFTKMTRHRGSFHSILAAISFSLIVTWLSWRFATFDVNFSWALGGLLLIGYLTHLLLDECYSVNLANIQIKRSFGSALKPLSLRYWWASLGFSLVGAYCLWKLPNPATLTESLVELALVL